MKRNIVATIKFGIGKITFTVLEKLSTNMVEVFNATGLPSKASLFLDKCLATVNEKIGGELSEVFVVAESTPNTNARIKPHTQSINIAGVSVAPKDIDNVLSLSKKVFESEERKVILVQPIKFEVFDESKKSYSRAPINKKGGLLTVTSVITSISRQTFDYIEQVVKSKGLKIKQILLASQAISQNNLSESALSNGSILINIGLKQSFITINKNLSTLTSMSIFDFGYDNLVNGIVKVFGCTEIEARNLIIVYGSLNNNEEDNRVIYTHNNGLTIKTFKQKDLTAIMQSFMNNLLLVLKKFVHQKNVKHFPVILSGNVDKIGDILPYAQAKLEVEHLSMYNPISFAEINPENISSLGMAHFINRNDEVLGRQMHTIVETNPNTITSLKRKTNSSWWLKAVNKLGGKNVWK